MWLDLSNNQLLRIDDGAFSQLPRLIHLDLSNNQNLDILDGGYSFRGLEHTLLELKLNNVSLTTVSTLKFIKNYIIFTIKFYYNYRYPTYHFIIYVYYQYQAMNYQRYPLIYRKISQKHYDIWIYLQMI